MTRLLTLAVLGSILALPPVAHAGVSVNIGINLPGPPALVPVPGTPVMYAPAVNANYFAYGGQYYAFVGSAWYVSPAYGGPWAVVAPEFVPRPMLAVPVRYYRVVPPAWHGWRPEAAPHWEARWGRHWTEHHAHPEYARHHERYR